MRALPLLALTTVLMSPLAAAADPVIFAAASMKTALDEIAQGWGETHDPVTISYAGSSKLARQIEAGAPADMFISASTDWMDEVETSGATIAGTRHDLLGNALVLVAHDDVQTAPADLPKALGQDGFLAMALVDSVPAGVYGKQALTHLGLWDQLSAHVAQADNVRAALALVATGESPYGIVYATDAHAEPHVHIAATFPEDSHDAITYPVALLNTGADAAGAKAFLAYLTTPAAKKIFAAQGFTVKP
ncbi:molybdate ABC transporter substrate-binding protein [Thioclava litoralis]|uniref:Molybdate ABC transporter substrate-binding protein n=1 Tax=Thioclava litoralis TaxID=3076557 RepID=A0ABZ1E1G9_9RHOB|nr:molybdate ABC transporter substrate-binding protein [Thioclava sp. FTW29]